MPTSYTSLLNLALPVTGELSGTWGDTVNDYITKYVDSSVAGTQTISGTQTAVTLTRASGASLSPVGSGSTGSSQYAIINCTGSPASTLTITVDVSTGSPTLSNSTYSQTFAVINATSTSQSVVVRATTTSGTSTGVTMVSGERALIAWSGSDFTKIATSVADGVTTFSAGTTGFTPSTATSGAVTLAGTLATTNGGTGLTSFTANGVVYASSTSALTTGSALVFDGSNLGIGTSSPSTKLHAKGSGGTIATFERDASGTIAYFNRNTGSGNAGAIIGADSVAGYFAGGNSTSNMVYLDSVNNLAQFYTNNTERARIDSSGNLGVGTGSNTLFVRGTFASSNTATSIGTQYNPGILNIQNTSATNGNLSLIGFQDATSYINLAAVGAINTTHSASPNNVVGELAFYTKPSGSGYVVERARITSTGFTQPVAYADTVSALGNTGTATTIDCRNANVFTATLTGNCTFTLSNPIATGSSSFTLILTNDGTAGRTVAWAGGSFVFPGGAASLSRTTTANAVDVWVFFTPNGGTTWYGNIAMKDMKA